MKRLPVFLLLGSSLLLTACWEKTPPAFLPEGVQTMTGTLIPAEISTLRRGSHLLTEGGKRLCFVESTSVNLRSLEGKNVVIRGVFEANSDPTLLPVLVAEDAQTVEKDQQSVSLPAFDLKGQAPRSWMMATQAGATVFVLEGSATPLISISLAKQTPLPSDGVPFTIAGKHAIRRTDRESGTEIMAGERGADLLTLTFTPPKAPEEAEVLRAQWMAFLSSLQFGATASSRSGSATSGAADGAPCGGTAGILCPPGQYCAITDFKENIGRCRSVSAPAGSSPGVQ